jgi:hypothetical protein
MSDILHKELFDEIIGVCIEVHKLMGSHFSERIYKGVCAARAKQTRPQSRRAKMD